MAAVHYVHLVPGQRYAIHIGYAPDHEVLAGNYPYNGVFVDYDPVNENPIFTSIRTARGNTIAGEQPFEISNFEFTEYVDPVPPPPPLPPKPWPQRNIPPNTDDLINAMPITEGMDMVDFHGEYGYGRYYPVEVYDALVPKQNPMTRRPILPAEVQYYTAHIAPPGGRRKTKKSKRRARTTRVLGTRKSRRRYK
jgi:hypothetical protein